MWLSRRLVVSVSVALAAGLGLLTMAQIMDDPPEEPGGPRVVQPGAPGQPGRTLPAGELSSVRPPAHSAADVRFMQRMILHHAQALRMTAMVRGRGASPDLPRLAVRLETSQRDEITQMEGWLRERGEPPPAWRAGHEGHGELMPGMLTKEQLSELERTRGAEFDRLFLERMIRHHRGALAMVQELYATGGGIEPASDRFARDVNADQTIEISRMRQLLVALAG